MNIMSVMKSSKYNTAKCPLCSCPLDRSTDCLVNGSLGCCVSATFGVTDYDFSICC